MEQNRKHRPAHKLDKASQMLKDQHDEVKKLFKAFDDAGDDNEKMQLCEQACHMLTLHSQLEQQTYYPTVKDQIDDPSMVDEGLEEHAMVAKAIADLDAMRAGGEDFEGRFKAMREAVQHHVEEEEKQLFPMVAKADVDTEALSVEMADCWQALQNRAAKAKGKSRPAE